MRGVFSLVALVVVLGVVAVNVRNQLQATRSLAPANGAASASASAGASAASAPFGGTSSPSVAQFQQELDRTLQGVAAQRAASAGGDADATR